MKRERKKEETEEWKKENTNERKSEKKKSITMI